MRHMLRSQTRPLFWVYLSLSILGLATAWIFNGLAIAGNESYGQAWFGSAVDWVLTSDLGIVAIAAVIFMIIEARRLKMKRVWIYIALSAVTAMACTFPLFLAMREMQLAQQGDGRQRKFTGD